MKKILLRTAVLTAVPIIFSSCNTSPTQAIATEKPQDYPVMTVRPESAMLHMDYPARLEGRQNIEIRPKVDGFIAKIYIEEGSVVRKGQLLFSIHAPQYEQEVTTATAAIKSAEAEMNLARMQVEKTVPLEKEGIISSYELKSAEYTLHAREAALAQAKASLANAKTNVGYTHITSPADGVVGLIPYKTGSLVSSASPQPLTTVSDIGEMVAYFSWNEKQYLDFTYSHKGAQLNERVKSIPPVQLILANKQEYAPKGRIESVGGIINTTTGSIPVRALFPNSGRLLRTGASGLIRIPTHLKEAILIPAKATFELQEKTFVYTVKKDGAVQSTEIQIQSITPDGRYVVSNGLTGGEQVVTEGLPSLKDGMRIRPVEKAAAAQ
ncbi:MAG TPA: efflux RND transporter periplasmic adaptor subunit [Dyadobacter sp.]|nr:efflux RND transporter periplasmic adaptor subunit [Dyadobacter sp.]